MRGSIRGVLESEFVNHCVFSSPSEFLMEFDESPGCLLFDLQLPGMTGLELYRSLFENGVRHPLIMISGNAAIRDVVESMRCGAVDFLEKPFTSQCLLDSIDHSFHIVKQHYQFFVDLRTLTSQERKVLKFIRDGYNVEHFSKLLRIDVSVGSELRDSVHAKLHVSSDEDIIETLTQVER